MFVLRAVLVLVFYVVGLTFRVLHWDIAGMILVSMGVGLSFWELVMCCLWNPES